MGTARGTALAMANAAANALGNLAKAAIGLGVTGTALNASMYDVDGGKAAVMFDRFRGVLPKAVGEGTHFLVPFIQNPTVYDIRTRPKSISSVTGTKDLQQVNLTLRVLHRPEVARLPEIHTNLGPEYEERVLPSIG